MGTSAIVGGLTVEQVAEVRAELQKVVKSSSFSGSKRCQTLLEFIVERTLAGDYGLLTERFLGKEIFGRPIDYETALDAIVRVRANDVRRRLGQYYSGLRSETRVTISLRVGTYIPDFVWSEVQEVLPPPPKEEFPVPVIEVLPLDRRDISSPSRNKVIAILTLCALVLFASVFIRTRLQQHAGRDDAAMKFWQPVFATGTGETLCFGDTVSIWVTHDILVDIEENRPITTKPGEISDTRNDTASAGSIRAALSVLSVLNEHHVDSKVRWPAEVQETELASGNVIYIGAFSNSWTMSLNENLRFSFVKVDPPSGSVWMIRDRNSPNEKWSNTKAYPERIEHDYAVITRLIDKQRNRVVISLGGITQFGTQAAGEFLTDKVALNEFAHTAPKGWENKNLQIVLAMGVDGKKVINPKVVATEFW